MKEKNNNKNQDPLGYFWWAPQQVSYGDRAVNRPDESSSEKDCCAAS